MPGAAWVTVAVRRRGWKTPAIITALSVAVMNTGGILSLSDVFGHRHPIDPFFSQATPGVQEYLVLLGLLAVLVGIFRLVWALARTANRRTALVVTGLGLAAVVQGGILELETYELPHDHAPSGSFEEANVATALLAMMVDKGVSNVTPSARSTNSWADNPAGTGTSPLYPSYLRESNTACLYCWDSSGGITSQDKSSAPCGASGDGSVATSPCRMGMPSDQAVGRADYGYIVLFGATAVVVVALIGVYTWRRRKRGRYAHVSQ